MAEALLPSPSAAASTEADALAAERWLFCQELLEEGLFCFALNEPFSIHLPVDQQVHKIIHDSYLVECNPAMARMYGYSQPAELLGKRVADLFASMDLQNDDKVRAFVQAGYRAMHIETHEVDRAGRTLYIVNNVHGVVRDGRFLRFWGSQRDVTAERMADDLRQLRENRCSQVLDHLDQSVFMKDKDLRLVAANRRHCRNLGKSEAELIGKTDFELYPRHLAEKYRADDLLVLTQDRKVELEEQTLVAGELRTVRVVKAPVHDSLGRTVGLIGIFWDVTDQRALESQFRQAQKMDAIGQLAFGVANDFNNMLTAMLGNLELIGKHLPEDSPARSYHEAAEAAAVRAADLIGKLVSFSRKAPLRLEPLRPAEVVAQAVERLRPSLEPRVTCETRLPDDLWPIHADSSQVHQLLLNLGLNAKEAMPGGGQLLVECLNVRVEDDYVKAKPQARQGDFVCLQVSDTGVGIPEAMRGQLFEPFMTSKAGGQHLGLGLAMVYGIVDRHGGWIEFQTANDLGTTFSVFFPRYRPASASPAAVPIPPASAAWGQEAILFVEDEEILRRLGSSILTRHGYRVTLAADGHEAIRLYTEQRPRFDLVILDLSMPGLSGRDTYRRLKAYDPRIRVIFTSGQFDELAAQAEEDPALGCIGKPYRADELARIVQAALRPPGDDGMLLTPS